MYSFGMILSMVLEKVYIMLKIAKNNHTDPIFINSPTFRDKGDYYEIPEDSFWGPKTTELIERPPTILTYRQYIKAILHFHQYQLNMTELLTNEHYRYWWSPIMRHFSNAICSTDEVESDSHHMGVNYCLKKLVKGPYHYDANEFCDINLDTLDDILSFYNYSPYRQELVLYPPFWPALIQSKYFGSIIRNLPIVETMALKEEQDFQNAESTLILIDIDKLIDVGCWITDEYRGLNDHWKNSMNQFMMGRRLAKLHDIIAMLPTEVFYNGVSYQCYLYGPIIPASVAINKASDRYRKNVEKELYTDEPTQVYVEVDSTETQGLLECVANEYKLVLEDHLVGVDIDNDMASIRYHADGDKIIQIRLTKNIRRAILSEHMSYTRAFYGSIDSHVTVWCLPSFIDAVFYNRVGYVRNLDDEDQIQDLLELYETRGFSSKTFDLHGEF